MMNENSNNSEGNKVYGMEQGVFWIFIDCRGHHRKGVAIYNAT